MPRKSSKIQAKGWQPNTSKQSKSNPFSPRAFPTRSLAGASSVHSERVSAKANRSLPNLAELGENVQTKLTIGEVGDKYEQEADRVAKDVVQRINSTDSPPPSNPSERWKGTEETVQRRFSGPSRQRANLWRVQRTGSGRMEASGPFESQLKRSRGGGKRLDRAFRARVEPVMGADFSGVRVHTDSAADRLSRSIQAKAFTTGRDVFFRRGAYQPKSRGGQELLAHELTHVQQQNS